VTARLLPRPYSLSVLAEVGDRFSDFEPYVASINDAGVVCFQAKLRGGGSGVYTAHDGTISTVVETVGSTLREVVSHPDIDADGSVCFYAEATSGGGGVFVARHGQLATIADSHGPLGPTMEARGAIAFRAATSPSASGIFRHVDGVTSLIADNSRAFTEFQGLPVINGALTVAFRADLANGGQGIYVVDGDAISTVIETGDAFTDLGQFPNLVDDGTVAFCATLQTGTSGVFTVSNGEVKTIIDSAGAFATFRGVLMDGSGNCVFYATPRSLGAGFGIFAGSDPVADCILGLGPPLLGSTVADFALNPVSINGGGQLAIRVRLADDRQLVLRGDPVSRGG
jgi:hypothetical protein